MKEIIYKDWAYICIALILILASIYVVSTFSHGFFTAVDEGYFLIKLKEAYESSSITGKSQWNLLAIHLFPYLDLTNKTNSYLASCILRWFSIVVFTITCCILYKKERVFRYLAVFLLAYFSYGQDFGLSYVPMQTCALCWALCAYMLFQYYENKYLKDVLLALCGFCLCLSGFIIITGAIAVFPLFLIMIIVNAKKDIARIASNLFFLFGGFLFCLLYVHFIVCPINDIFNAMRDTASYISKSGHGYDGLSFLYGYVAFTCKLMYMVFYITGVYYVSSFFKNRITSWCVYTLAIILYFLKSPIMGGYYTIYVLTISLVAIPLLFSGKMNLSIKNISEKELLYCFLFLFPLFAPLGTNMGLEVRLINYIVSWMFIFFSYEYKKECKKYNFLMLPLFLLMLIPVYNVFNVNWNYDERYHFDLGNKNFSVISLTQKQKVYFDRIYSIMSKYNFKPNESVLFTTMYDYSTLYVIDAVNSTNFYHAENFHYFDKSKMLSPDFVILCPHDSALIAKDLQAMPWGWPDDFDAYDIGTPEDPDLLRGLPNNIFENRKLYCRRILLDSENYK